MNPSDPVCRLCRTVYGAVNSRDNHGYAHHGKPSSVWKATVADMDGVELHVVQRGERRPKKNASEGRSELEVLRGEKKSSYDSTYAKIISEKSPSASELAAKRLPWLRFPSNVDALESIADEAADLASTYRLAPDLHAFFLNLREHVIVLADIAARRDKAAA